VPFFCHNNGINIFAKLFFQTESKREIISDNLSNAGWNCGCISSTDHKGRQFWVVAAQREDAGRFIVRANEKLTAFWSLKRRLGIAANCLDNLARFFKTRRR
jgi:hypothetical protein